MLLHLRLRTDVANPERNIPGGFQCPEGHAGRHIQHEAPVVQLSQVFRHEVAWGMHMFEQLLNPGRAILSVENVRRGNEPMWFASPTAAGVAAGARRPGPVFGQKAGGRLRLLCPWLASASFPSAPKL